MSEDSSARDTMSLESNTGRTDAPHLPPEVTCIIISFVGRSQGTLHSCCMVSRFWYSVAVVQLYRSPFLWEKNYRSFFMGTCPSENVHKFRSPLLEMVKELDLRTLFDGVHESVTENLLLRVQRGMEVFHASLAEFS
jgi:hypothetical protein